MSLSKSVRLLRLTLSLNNIYNSPYSTYFLLSLPNIKPELEGHKCWPNSIEDDFTYYIKRSRNYSILTNIKQEDYYY